MSTAVKGASKTRKEPRWCDEQPGHAGECSRQIGSKMVHRQNGDDIDLSIRILENHRGERVMEIQLGRELAQLTDKERDWLRRQLDNCEKHTRD